MQPDGISLVLTFLKDADGFDSVMALAVQLQYQIPVEFLVIDDGKHLSIKPFIERCQAEKIPYRRIQSSDHKGLAIDMCVILARYQWVLMFWSDSACNLNVLLSCFENDPDITIAGVRVKNPGAISWNGLLALAERGYNPFEMCHILLKKEIFMLMGGCPMDAFSRNYADTALWKIWLRFFKGAVLHPEASVFERSNGVCDSVPECSDPSLLTQSAALRLIARLLNISLVCAGKLAYLAWNYYDYILADGDIELSLKQILSDRPVLPLIAAEDHLADRFLWFSWKRHANDKRIHHLEKLMDILKCPIG